MNHWTKLGLPIGLGLVASAMNWAATASKLAPYACVRVREDIAYGEPLDENLIERVEINGEIMNFPKTFVPWKDRAVLYGHPAPRPFTDGDLVMWRDAEPHKNILPTKPGELPMSVSLGGTTVVPEFIQVGQQVSFFVGKEQTRSSDRTESRDADWTKIARQIGPFRVLAVGKRTLQAVQGDTSDDRVLTIATRVTEGGVLDDQSDRLLAALKGFDGVQVMGVTLHAPPGRLQRIRPITKTSRRLP